MLQARWSLRLSRQAIRRYGSRSTSKSKPQSRIKPKSKPQRVPPSIPPSASQARNAVNPQGHQSSKPSGPLSSASQPSGPQPSEPPAQQPEEQTSISPNAAVAQALQEADANNANPLQAPVHIPDDPHGILTETHPAMSILANSTIIVQRQIEYMAIMGLEQANRYIISDPHGNHIGYLAEQDHGTGNTVARHAFRTHRSFTTHVFDRDMKEVLRFHRPFSWISSTIRVYDAGDLAEGYTQFRGSREVAADKDAPSIADVPLKAMRVIGEAQQEWAALRRKYNLFLHRDLDALERDSDAPQLTSGELPLSNSTAVTTSEGDNRTLGMAQFAYVSEPMLSYDFALKGSDHQLVGSVNREFGGFMREAFTDTGCYALRMDAAGIDALSDDEHSEDIDVPGMTLDQRAVMLATAVSIDFDYFSRQSRGMGGWLPIPLWFPGGGGAAAEAGAVGAAGAEGGAVAEAGALGVGAAARGAGGATMGEAGAVGAGTMAGYEAMRRGSEGQAPVDDQSPMAADPYENGFPQDTPGQGGQPLDGWDKDPWNSGGGGGGSAGGSGGGIDGGSGGGGGGGGGGGWDWGDFF